MPSEKVGRPVRRHPLTSGGVNFYYRAEEADAYMDHLEARIAELGAREEALARLALGV